MKSNTTLLIIVTLLVAAVAYWYFFTGTGNQPPLSAINTPVNQTQMQFETLVGELQSVSFNTAIFSDARFNALTDIATPVAPESFGRLDPLAPTSASRTIISPTSPIITPPPAINEARSNSGTSSPAVDNTP